MVPRHEQPPRRPSPPRESSVAKPSFISPTSSVDGDDEESSLDRPSSEMERQRHRPGHRGVPQYPGEDTRLTSQKELAGWYSYGWAAEVFVICAMGSFLPIALEQLARDQGVRLSDKKTPCKPSWKTTISFNPTVPPNSLTASPFADHEENPPCIINFLGHEVNTASFAMYTFSLSVLVQALIIISMSGAADHGRFRKTFLLGFAFTGAVAMMLFLAVVPQIYLLGAVLAIVANTCFGASFVLLNSFLPLLVRYHPSIQYTDTDDPLPDDSLETSQTSDTAGVGTDEETDPGAFGESSLLLAGDVADSTAPLAPIPAAISPELKLSTKISSNGIGIGYIAGVLVQCFAILIVVATGSTTFSLRLVLFVVGVWWFVFSIPAVLWLRPRPGPPLSAGGTGKERSWFGYVAYAWASLGRTALRARRLKDMVLFLGAWFLLSDGIATVSGTAVLFAKTQLDMKPAALGLINVIATISGVCGAFSWSFFSRLFNLRASQTIIACICLFELIPLYGLLGFIPAVKELGFLGLQQPWEMYPLGAVYGFVLGGLSSYCRSFFGELIPPGSEAAFYALYAITDKGSSIFGPAIVGAITDRYGEIRPAFIFLAVLIFLPLPMMMVVDVDRGKKEAAEMAAGIEGKTVNGRAYGAIPTIEFSGDDDDDD